MIPIEKGFTCYYRPSCGYSQSALQTLKQMQQANNKLPVRYVDVDTVKGGKDEVLRFFKQNARKYKFDTRHTTVPIIFYDNQFIGGYTELRREASPRGTPPRGAPPPF